MNFDARLGREPVRVRPLPPPFSGWCTVSSDADAPDMQGFVSSGTVLREHFALPISDSIFPHFIYNQGLVASENFESLFPDFGKGDRFDLEVFVGRCSEWLRQVYRGRVDTVHGWLLRQQIRIGDDAVFRRPLRNPVRKRSGAFLRRVLRAAGKSLPAFRQPLNFRLPVGWHPRVPPRYLVFEYRAIGLQGPVTLVFTDGGKTIGEVDMRELAESAPEMPTVYLVDMVELLGNDANLLKRVQVELWVRGWPELVELRRPMMVSWLRAQIEEQLCLLEAFNIRFTTYTSHGGGYNIGHTLGKDLDAADPRGMAELEQNPYYAMDLFQRLGMRYFNTANNTSRRHPVRMQELVFPRVINDGSLIYDFHRYLYIPRNRWGGYDYSPFERFGSVQSPSLANFAGWQIEHLLQEIDKAPGLDTGGVVYTHLLSRCIQDPDRLDRSVEGIFTGETRQALKRLAERYYGVGGRDGKRVFVAPLATLLRYATVLQRIVENSAYDRETNTIHVSGWVDPITGDRVPACPGDAGRELRHVTFYVKDAATARLFVDGRECTALVRNSDDGVGESVTIPPLGEDTPLVGLVPCSERSDCRMVATGCHLEYYGKGHRMKLEADEAWIEFEYEGISLADHYGVRLVLSGDIAGVKWCLELVFGAGLSWKAVSGNADGEMDTVRVPCGPEINRQDVVIPFYRFAEVASHDELPGSELRRVRLRILGGRGRKLMLERLSLLRDDPRAPSDVCIVGGRVSSALGLERICMEYAGEDRVTPILESGWFVFLDPVPRGSVVRIRGEDADGRKVLPDCGGTLEVTTDTLEINFGGRPATGDGAGIG